MKRTLLAACILAGSIGGAVGDPIIPNSGFELGNTGFTSGYGYQTDLVPEGFYFVGGDSLSHNSNWTQNVSAHSGNNYMIVNGDPNAGVVVYDSSGISVLADTQYYFSAFATSLYPDSPATLQFSINGLAINAPLTISPDVGVWQQIFVPWFSGSSTTADISLLNENTARTGNDFGLDDISLSTTSPTSVPEPLTLSLFGAGFVGAAALRRRRRKQISA